MTPEGPRVAAPSSCGTEDSARSYHSPPPCLWHYGMEKRIWATEIPPGDAMHPIPPLRPSTKGRKVPSPGRNVEPALTHATHSRPPRATQKCRRVGGAEVLD